MGKAVKFITPIKDIRRHPLKIIGITVNNQSAFVEEKLPGTVLRDDEQRTVFDNGVEGVVVVKLADGGWEVCT